VGEEGGKSANTDAAGGAWSGDIEIHHRDQSSLDKSVGTFINDDTTMNNNNNNNNNNNSSYSSNNHEQKTSMDALADFQNVASVLAGSSSRYSRYNADRYKAYSSRFIPTSNSSSVGEGRHMVWDDDEEEEEEEEDEDVKRRRIAMEEMRWDRTEEDMQEKLDSTWNNFFSVDHTNSSESTLPTAAAAEKKTTGAGTASSDNADMESSSSMSTHNPASALKWSHYYMPPHPPPSLYQSPLPFPTSSSTTNPNPHCSLLQSHNTGLHLLNTPPLTKAWREEVLSDKIRKWMERCDNIRGINIMVDSDGKEGLWGGLAESVVMEMRDECRSAAIMGVCVDSYDSGGDNNDDESGGKGRGRKRDYWRGEKEVASSVRHNINRGLTLAGLASGEAGGGCDVLVPISLGSCFGRKEGYSTFEASAVGALALETATLPYRLRRGGSENGRRNKIGIQSGYFQGGGGLGGEGDNDAFGSTDRLSYHEFLSSLRPSNRHVVLELSTSMVCGGGGSPTTSSLHDALSQGTSIERRKLEEERNRNYSSFSSRSRRTRGRDIDPGLWMEDIGPCGGSLIPLTPSSPSDGDGRSRSLHRHYALSASFRPASSAAAPVVRSRQSLLSSSHTTDDGTVSSYTTMLMEGMGIRYRPETCVGTVVNQSLNDLIGSRAYGAGSYWKTVLRNGRGVSTTTPAVPILTVLGNTTRSHSHLHSRARGMKDSLSAKYSGYRRKDCTAGIIPELEDCTEAMEVCDSLRDLYEPLMGGAGDEEMEGAYFEDNED